MPGTEFVVLSVHWPLVPLESCLANEANGSWNPVQTLLEKSRNPWVWSWAVPTPSGFRCSSQFTHLTGSSFFSIHMRKLYQAWPWSLFCLVFVLCILLHKDSGIHSPSWLTPFRIPPTGYQAAFWDPICTPFSSQRRDLDVAPTQDRSSTNRALSSSYLLELSLPHELASLILNTTCDVGTDIIPILQGMPTQHANWQHWDVKPYLTPELCYPASHLERLSQWENCNPPSSHFKTRLLSHLHCASAVCVPDFFFFLYIFFIAVAKWDWFIHWFGSPYFCHHSMY